MGFYGPSPAPKDIEATVADTAKGAHDAVGWGFTAMSLTHASIAISLKRIADMMAEDRR